MKPRTPDESWSIATAAFQSMRQFEVSPTPENYALWHEYHAGTNIVLQRTIEALISNEQPFDEKTLEDLYANYFSLAKEKRAVRDTSHRVLDTLKDIVSIANCAREDAREFGTALTHLASSPLGRTIDNLRELIEQLVSESQRMAGRTEYVSVRMQESAQRIETLERDLEHALRDASLDGLTGVANRRSFDCSLRRLAGEAMNSGDELSLLLIDIDHFKRVNDTWGHQTGDLVLRHLGQTLEQGTRGEDIVARYGGEEFAVLLARTAIESAAVVGDNLRQLLLRQPCRLDSAPTLSPITVSIGVATYDPGEALTEWIARADKALYSAKQEGRNCVRSIACCSA